jgi:hypothetical protein
MTGREQQQALTASLRLKSRAALENGDAEHGGMSLPSWRRYSSPWSWHIHEALRAGDGPGLAAAQWGWPRQ